MNILIVEDNAYKISNIRRVIDSLGLKELSVSPVADINGAMRVLKEENVNVLILDLFIPQMYGQTPLPEGGMKLLKDLNRSRRLHYPEAIISLSEHVQETIEFSEGEGAIHSRIVYDSSNTKWETELKTCILAAEEKIQNMSEVRHYKFDVAVVCALKEELDQVKKLVSNITQVQIDEDDFIYESGIIHAGEREIKVIMAHAFQMGMVAAATLSSAIIAHFSPRFIVMTGIAGGTKKEPDDVIENSNRSGREYYGDIVIAARTWDYQAGKEVAVDDSNQHLNTIAQEVIDSSIQVYCERLALDTSFLSRIREEFDGDKPEVDLMMHIGPMVSGASVVGNHLIVEDILNNQERSVLGVDMETYGVYYASKWGLKPRPKYVSIKSISDFADEHKNDKYHKYAAYTSAKVFEKLAKEYFEY